MKEEKAK